MHQTNHISIIQISCESVTLQQHKHCQNELRHTKRINTIKSDVRELNVYVETTFHVPYCPKIETRSKSTTFSFHLNDGSNDHYVTTGSKPF